MTNSRTKGRAGEQELVRILKDELRLDIRRNWMAQNAEKLHADIMDVPGWAIEVRRAKVPRLPDWWAQAAAQALQCHRKPVLIYRLDRQPWLAQMSLYDLVPELQDHSSVTLSLTSWCKLVRRELDGAESGTPKAPQP